LDALSGELMLEPVGAQQKIIGVEPARLGCLLTRDLGELYGRLDRGDHAFGDAVLQVEDVAEPAIEAVGPQMPAGVRIDQLSGDAQALAAAADAAFEHIGDAKLAPDLADIYGPVLVEEGGVAGDDEQPAAAGQRGDDVLRHAVGEKILLGIAAHVGEGENGNRRRFGLDQTYGFGNWRRVRCLADLADK